MSQTEWVPSDTSSDPRSVDNTLVWMVWDPAQEPSKYPELSCLAYHTEYELWLVGTLQHGHSI